MSQQSKKHNNHTYVGHPNAECVTSPTWVESLERGSRLSTQGEQMDSKESVPSVVIPEDHVHFMKAKKNKHYSKHHNAPRSLHIDKLIIVHALSAPTEGERIIDLPPQSVEEVAQDE